MEKNDYNLIREAVSKLLNVDTVIKRKNKSRAQKKREIFAKVITSLEEVLNRSNILYVDAGMDFSSYDEKFLSIIDLVLFMHFDQQCFELISWYLYDRLGSDGQGSSKLLNEEGEEVLVENAYDLYDVIQKINPNV